MNSIKGILSIIVIIAISATSAKAAENYTIYQNPKAQPKVQQKVICDQFTSQPDYNKMEIINIGQQWSVVSIIEPSTYRYVNYSEAYQGFLNIIDSTIYTKCNTGTVHGAANINIKINITDH
ncbi:MAG TPA: hypothetical protein HPP97_06490 [Desulfuromonadales bacterium]|nr:hypothetical protein [Desulfuromonadales bacterium]